ncbi:pyrimidine 5'-nucleotidase [Hydrogenophilus thermoluteolus]|nr:pyrimidine 5'-nucleotidase [Hydrogenophilus thermoluteolus]MBW7657399.1 pyrimidine 5'-nucleotidase [Hydrogenophilus thermoluteolus]
MTTPIWIFDLDNTLHHASAAIFPHLNRQMTAYLMRHLALNEAEANALRVRYWRAYGATLVGLIRHHRINPRHFLRETHHFDNLAAHIHAPKRLAATLAKLPGAKVLFTNGPRAYARAIVEHLGIHRHFVRLFAIEDLDYHPKPRRRAYAAVLHAMKVAPSRCILVEDSAENLAPAKQLGMTTVWVTRARGLPPHVDWKIATVTDLPKVLGRWGVRSSRP